MRAAGRTCERVAPGAAMSPILNPAMNVRRSIELDLAYAA